MILLCAENCVPLTTTHWRKAVGGRNATNTC
jgi:hypothetical protein